MRSSRDLLRAPPILDYRNDDKIYPCFRRRCQRDREGCYRYDTAFLTEPGRLYHS